MMKTVAFLSIGLSLLTSLSAIAESASVSAALGGKYEVEMLYRLPPRFKAQAPTIHTEDIHDGFDLKCVSDLEFTGAVLQIRLFKAGTREQVSSVNVPVKMGRTEYVSINEESDCKKPSDFATGLQSIGVRDGGIEIPLPGTSQVIRMRLESGQSLAEGRLVREGDQYRLEGFRMDPPATASLYWDRYDRANRNFLESYQKSEARFTKQSARDQVPHAASAAVQGTHR